MQELSPLKVSQSVKDLVLHRLEVLHRVQMIHKLAILHNLAIL